MKMFLWTGDGKSKAKDGKMPEWQNDFHNTMMEISACTDKDQNNKDKSPKSSIFINVVTQLTALTNYKIKTLSMINSLDIPKFDY